jgi:5-methylcytosine-specific restriction protein A
MPIRAKRPCKYQPCPNLVDSGYCDLHEAKVADRRRQEQNDDAFRPFYKSKRWETTRLVVLHRDLICQECKKTAAKVVHHVVDARIWVGRGNDFYDEENLQGLCEPCHNAISRERQ